METFLNVLEQHFIDVGVAALPSACARASRACTRSAGASPRSSFVSGLDASMGLWRGLLLPLLAAHRQNHRRPSSSEPGHWSPPHSLDSGYAFATWTARIHADSGRTSCGLTPMAFPDRIVLPCGKAKLLPSTRKYFHADRATKPQVKASRRSLRPGSPNLPSTELIASTGLSVSIGSRESKSSVCPWIRCSVCQFTHRITPWRF